MGESRSLTVWAEPVEEENDTPVETRFIAALVLTTRVAAVVGFVWGARKLGQSLARLASSCRRCCRRNQGGPEAHNRRGPRGSIALAPGAAAFKTRTA